MYDKEDINADPMELPNSDPNQIRKPSPTMMDVYDNDTLNYMEKSVHDDIKGKLLEKIDDALLTPDCKNAFKLLVESTTSFEYVVTNYNGDKELRTRKFELRESIGWLKVNTREVNLVSGDFTYIMSLVERHFANKITRARAGFTTESQITQNINTRQTLLNKQVTPEPKSGMNRIFSGGK